MFMVHIVKYTPFEIDLSTLWVQFLSYFIDKQTIQSLPQFLRHLSWRLASMNGLTHPWLDVYLTSVVWTYQTFENNFGMKHKFAKYFKKNCR